MYNQTSLYDDNEQSVMIDSNLLGQIDQRLGDAFLTRESFIDAALQQYIRHIDDKARTHTNRSRLTTA